MNGSRNILKDNILDINNYRRVHGLSTEYSERLFLKEVIGEVIEEKLIQNNKEQKNNFDNMIELLREHMELAQSVISNGKLGNDNSEPACHKECLEEKKTLEEELSKKIENIETISNENRVLYEELEFMRTKIKYSVPVPCIVYMCITSVSFTFFILSYILSYLDILDLINPYFAFSGAVGSVVLFLTAFSGIKYWKERFMNGEIGD